MHIKPLISNGACYNYDQSIYYISGSKSVKFNGGIIRHKSGECSRICMPNKIMFIALM